MKRIYWRPPRASRLALLLIALISILFVVSVEAFPRERRQRWYGDKIAAARMAKDYMEAIKAEKSRLGILADPQIDPMETGMIGTSISPVTSNTGFIAAKLTSTNPNFAAVIVDLLKRAGVESGDTVAVGVSGSFPALNVCTFAAMHRLQLQPVIIASASSSEWGANNPELLWLDMERVLRDAELTNFKSIAASPGGIDDLGIGITKEGNRIIRTAIERNGTRMIEPKSLVDSIDRRMVLYEEGAAGRTIKAYINVGGGSASVGTHVGKKQFKAGLNTSPPRGTGLADSVMLRFSRKGIPVIHISRIKLLTERYELPYEPSAPVRIGQGGVYVKQEYNPWLAGGGVVGILFAMLAFIRLDVGVRMLGRMRHTKDGGKQPEQMV